MASNEGDLQVRGSELPYGAGQQLEDAADAAEDVDLDEDLDIELEDEGDDFDDVLDAEPFTPPTLQGPDAMLFAPSQRPERPVTTGIRGGAGPDDLPIAGEGHRAFLRRQAARLSSSPTAPPDVKVWAERVKRGQ